MQGTSVQYSSAVGDVTCEFSYFESRNETPRRHQGGGGGGGGGGAGKAAVQANSQCTSLVAPWRGRLDEPTRAGEIDGMRGDD